MFGWNSQNSIEISHQSFTAIWLSLMGMIKGAKSTKDTREKSTRKRFSVSFHPCKSFSEFSISQIF